MAFLRLDTASTDNNIIRHPKTGTVIRHRASVPRHRFLSLGAALAWRIERDQRLLHGLGSRRHGLSSLQPFVRHDLSRPFTAAISSFAALPAGDTTSIPYASGRSLYHLRLARQHFAI